MLHAIARCSTARRAAAGATRIVPRAHASLTQLGGARASVAPTAIARHAVSVAQANPEDVWGWIVEMFAVNGDTNYDENVTQRQHALQSGLLAEQEWGPDSHEMITASLLHDIGHLLLDEHAGDESFLEEDLEHEVVGQNWLERYFQPAVTLPVLYHVAAKRYWTCIDQAYYDGLSISSKRSLEVQGGPFTPEEAEEFIALEGAQDAAALRLWDDKGKKKGMETPPLEYFKPYVMKCL